MDNPDKNIKFTGLLEESGFCFSMDTLKECRRKEIAGIRLKKVIAEARSSGCRTVQITASDRGAFLIAISYGLPDTPKIVSAIIQWGTTGEGAAKIDDIDVNGIWL